MSWDRLCERAGMCEPYNEEARMLYAFLAEVCDHYPGNGVLRCKLTLFAISGCVPFMSEPRRRENPPRSHICHIYGSQNQHLIQSAYIRNGTGRMHMVPSSEPEDSVAPSGEKATCVTLSLCSLNLTTHDPSLLFHSRTIPSALPEAMYFPLGENDAEVTAPSCSSKERRCSPL